MSSFHTAAAMNAYVRRTVEKDVKRLHPDPRTAQVVEIRDGHCLVTYSGESSVVKVPYNNLAPSYEGQVVLIDGPWDDRRIVEVIGRTSFESRIEATEDFGFSPPLWFQSMMEYPETYPVIMSNNVVELTTASCNVSPMVAPRSGNAVRVEIRLLAPVSNATLKLSLYRASADFSVLSHVETSTMSGNTFEPGFTLANPAPLAADDLLCIVASKVSGDKVSASCMFHPKIPPSREGQFSMATFPSSYQGNDVTRDLVTDSNAHTMWGVALPYVA